MSTAVAAQPVKITLGTATPGGGFPVYGAAFVAAIKSVDPGIEIEPVNTRGSTENVPRLEAGTLDIALVQGEVIHEALSGIGRAPANIKVLWAMYSGAGMFVVRDDSPYRTIDDLKGKPIAWGAAGSGLTILGRYVMDGLGLDRRQGFPAGLSREGGRRSRHGARRPGRGALGRRHRMAGLQGGDERARRRPLHRAERGRDRPHRSPSTSS